jgi:hypothetical protein
MSNEAAYGMCATLIISICSTFYENHNSVCTSAEHHRAQPPVTNGQRVRPPYSRLVVTKHDALRTGVLLDTGFGVSLAPERKRGGGYQKFAPGQIHIITAIIPVIPRGNSTQSFQ